MTRCNQRLDNHRTCELPPHTGITKCWWHGIGKPNAERWHAQRNARLLAMTGMRPARDAPLDTERWR